MSAVAAPRWSVAVVACIALLAACGRQRDDPNFIVVAIDTGQPRRKVYARAVELSARKR